MRRNYLNIAVLLILVFACLALAAGCDQSDAKANAQENANTKEKTGAETEAPQPKRVVVSTTTVQPTRIRDILVLPGETKPWQDVTLAADQGGSVEMVGPKEGDTVKKGDLVIQVDVSALKAALDNAQAAFRLADQSYKRRLNLFNRKIISREELDQTRTDREVKMGSLRQAKVAYEHGFIRSPIDGVVNKVYVDPGEFVGTGGPVMDIVNVDKIEIHVNVPELDVRYIKPQQQALIRVDAFPDENIIGTVEYVAFKADEGTKTFMVKVVIDNSDKTVRPGMIARVIFQKRVIPDALVAPLFALVDKGGERLLYVVENETARARVVELGVIEGDTIQIRDGLKVGDQLIVTGQTDVQEGTKVTVK